MLPNAVDATVDGALCTEQPWRLRDKERRLLQMLRDHKGARCPLPLARISQSLELCPRAVKATVKMLVEDFGIPIGASRDMDGSGYFLIVTAEDMAKALRPLTRELESIARRVRALQGIHAVEEAFAQARLNLGE